MPNTFYAFLFIEQRVKACAIPCPYQPLTRGDNTVSVAQVGTATPGATKQLLMPNPFYTYILKIEFPNTFCREHF